MDKQIFYDQLCEEEQDLLKQEKEIALQAEIINDKIKALQLLIQYYNPLNPITDKVADQYIESRKLDDSIKGIQQSFISGDITPKKNYKKRNKLTVPGMVLNSLSAIQRGSSNDVAIKLTQLYPSVSFEKASKDAKHHLSLFSKDGKVKIFLKRPGKLGFIYQSIDTPNIL